MASAFLRLKMGLLGATVVCATATAGDKKKEAVRRPAAAPVAQAAQATPAIVATVGPQAAAVTVLPLTVIGGPAASKVVPVSDAAPFQAVVAGVPCPAPAAGGWNGGGGALFLTPYLTANTAYTVITPPAPPPPGVLPVSTGSARAVPFDYGHDTGWQGWLGWTHASGWGVRLGAFGFGGDAEPRRLVNQSDPAAPRTIAVPPTIPPIPGAAGFGSPSVILGAAGLGVDRLSFTSELRVRSFDAVVTREVAFDDALLVVSGGGRVTSLRQKFAARLDKPGAGATFETQELRFTQDFSGAGPTAGLYMRQGLFGSRLSVFGSARGSILVGPLEQKGTFFQNISDPALLALSGSQQTRTRFDSDADHVMPVAELELGLEYGVPVGASRLFLRGGVFGQSYFNAGNATSSTGTLNLLGGQVSAGVHY